MTSRSGRAYPFAVVQTLAAIALFWLLIKWKTPWDLQRIVGMVLFAAGFSLIGIARYQLGNSFSVTPQAHALVTHGLYSKIRNPIYVFGAVMLAGIIMVFRQPVLWIVLVAVVVAQMIRARREARVLEAAFGDAYREYRRKTWL